MIGRQSLVTSIILYTALLLFPTLLYVFFYQESRIDEATMRNFRSLGTAADRIDKVLTTFRRYTKNYALGIDRMLLDSIDESCSDKINDLKKIAELQRSQSTLGLTSHALLIKQPNQSGDKRPESLNQTNDEDPPPTDRSSEDVSGSNGTTEECEGQVIASKSCTAGDRKLGLGPTKIVSRDCRTLRERDKRVFDALNESGGAAGAQLIGLSDRFGIEVSRDTTTVFESPTAHLSLFFDNYYIADEQGRVIFASLPKPQPHDDHRRHRAGVPFASVASVQDLLAQDRASSPLALFGGAQEAGDDKTTTSLHKGHSMVRNIQVGDVDLSVFIHPFTTFDQTLYVVGVVLRSSLTSEAIRIRLGPATDAILVIAVLLTLLPILRFWTAGDRSILRRFSLYSICGSVLAGSALCVVLLSGFNLKAIDGEILDRRLESIGFEIAKNFAQERAAMKGGLEDDLKEMGRCARHLNSPLPGSAEIKKHLVCPTCLPDHHLPYPQWPFHTATLDWSLPQSSEQEFAGWWPTSSFLLDEDGRRTICKRYRDDNISLTLDLKFRDYFKDAGLDLRLHRIDSVVRGENQIVGSFRNPDVNSEGGHVVVAIQKFWSIDGLTLPPHFHYAVLESSGQVIFHSEGDRNSVSNFISDTGNDAGLRAAMAYGSGVTLGLHYDGVPIRAHVTKLHSDEDWMLIVFRNHALVDKTASLVSSLSITLWLLTTLATFGLVGLATALPRPNGRRLLPAAIEASTGTRAGVVGAALAAVGVLACYGLRGGVLVWVGLLWPLLVAFTVFALAWLQLTRVEERRWKLASFWRPRWPPHLATTRRRRGPATTRTSIPFKVGVLFLLVFSYSVVPTLAWQGYFRDQLSTGLAAHLEREAEGQVREAVENFRRHTKELTYVEKHERSLCKGDSDVVRAFYDVGAAGFDSKYFPKRIRRIFCRGSHGSDTGLDGSEGWAFTPLSSLLAYSPVTWQATWYGFGGAHSSVDHLGGVPGRIRSVGDAVEHVVGVSAGESEIFWSGNVRRWFVSLLGIGLVMFLCYSAVRMKFGYEDRVVRLRSFPGSDGKLPERPLLLIKRSDEEVRRLKETLSRRYFVRCLEWRGSDVVWRDFSAGLGGRLEVLFVEDFRSATKGARGHRLAAELTRRGGEGKVVICSDVVPLYYMDSGTVDGRLSMRSAWPNVWRELIVEFDVCVLNIDAPDSGGGERTRTAALLYGGSTTNRTVGSMIRRANIENERFDAIGELLGLESKANTDFRGVIAEIAERLSKEDDLSSAQRRERALREFRAVAQSKFRTLWTFSSFDERAQLCALAQGGSLNRVRPAAISSLVNRGLITHKDPMKLYSEAFGQFIVEDVDDSLEEWRRKGQRDWWRITWLPLVLFAGLGLLFFINANPEAIGAIAAILAVFIGIVPVITSLLRVGQVVHPAVSPSDE